MSLMSAHFRVRRRFMRSVNLDRDNDDPDCLAGYVLTTRGQEVLVRVAESLIQPRGPRAWTLTGVYGTGKSAFASLLCVLCGPATPARKRAIEIVRGGGARTRLALDIPGLVSQRGLVRSVSVGRREPLDRTVLRGLVRGVTDYWSRRPGPNPGCVKDVLDLWELVANGSDVVRSDIPRLVSEVAKASGTGVLILTDELGKSLEHAASTGSASDVYLLQELAELPEVSGTPPVLIVGLLHQTFSEYGSLLASRERVEWEKVQGRFEDIPFTDSQDQILHLLSSAIDSDPPAEVAAAIESDAQKWYRQHIQALDDPYYSETMPPTRIEALYPLHPATALALPALCTRYGQNERSAFTFLAGSEPHALTTFLHERSVTPKSTPYLRIQELYDYFLGNSGVAASGRVRSHRWTEVQSCIKDADGSDPEEVEALKVIGTFNLLASSGPLRASRDLVLLALQSRPGVKNERTKWARILRRLVKRGVVTYRRQIDEYRVWQGSDFDIEAAAESHAEVERRSLGVLLSELNPLPPVVAQRHSYRTGTLRYFDRVYTEKLSELNKLDDANVKGDGLVVYWLGDSIPKRIPATLRDGRPIAFVAVTVSSALRNAVTEVVALESIDRNEVALQTDGVARREVRRRIAFARDVLDAVLLDIHAQPTQCRIWYGGDVTHHEGFNAGLSSLCDKFYARGPVLWNELINRDELTSQGARAQRELIAALLTNHATARFGIEGFGPEYSMYASLFESTGIHREQNGRWVLGGPEGTGLDTVWHAIEEFCTSRRSRPEPISTLYQLLESPPYGMKTGAIPLLMAAVLIDHSDDVSVYQDGSFLPVLRPAHFERLVKDPRSFSVKAFELRGVRWEIFRDLESFFREGGAQRPKDVRNATLLTVVRPLVRFAAGLPPVTRNATDLSAEATAVRNALLTVSEPDELIFDALPLAVGQTPFGPEAGAGLRTHTEFKDLLVEALRELQMHYDVLLDCCRGMIHAAFGVRADACRLREDLRVRASYLVGGVVEPRLRAFVLAAADDDASDREWVESLAMIVSDRPAEKWGSEGLAAFEASLPDFARRFGHLEALHRQAVRQGIDGFDARRVTITEPSGHEVNKLIWVDRHSRGFVEDQARQFMSALNEISDVNQRNAVLLTIIERALDGGGRLGSGDQGTAANVDKEYRRNA